MTSLETAKINFNEDGNPISAEFDDIYFSRQDGLQESYQVFQDGNQLESRWLKSHERHFTVAETGFGTGLNFFALCKRFVDFKQRYPDCKVQQLQFISFEKYPLSLEKFKQALSVWPELNQWWQHLIDHYPNLVAGPHRIRFPENIILDLWLGDVNDSLTQLQSDSRGLIDAWFLDGFAPQKNPQMWQQNLFDAMAQIGKEGCTFSTFTAAGFVRRGLIAAGFNVEKVPGFGHKRERLQGKLNEKPEQTIKKKSRLPELAYTRANSQKIHIIGGGVAAVCAALALYQRDIPFILHCQKQPADGASGNRQGAVYPLLQNNHNASSELQIKSFEYALAFYRHWQQQFEFKAEFKGLLQLGFSEEVIRRMLAMQNKGLWPESLIQWITASKASQIAGIELPCSALYFKNGGWLNPSQFVTSACQMLNHQNPGCIQSFSRLKSLTKGTHQNWLLECQTQSGMRQYSASAVIMANGVAATEFSSCQHLPLQAVRGQITGVSSSQTLGQLKTVLCHKGYLTPSDGQIHCLGASFVRNCADNTNNISDDEKNLDLQKKHLPVLENDLTLAKVTYRRASVRACANDHLPVMGPVFNASWPYTDNSPAGLYILSGLGSRGLTTAPLMAETLVASMCSESLALPRYALNAIHPMRFALRDFKRGKPTN
ncbi:bifunctional tRNA (5-methylaminomethyl-2-thiouridine)(34)-methyltransferase MnmD/FAD-dependent 5-carboxymethylaminomethyl-2-thiouridine(34) oxidoreductase MnmC [Gayadomonas joobiniege]|uniref:bifunctional tRNA (5-methylaminomethyl-2-thiouridine)(34)-methyltransferase MnmD/FAD-dependent 5-carboxymethylaminomethyl-2-thiouridine(34) oxidoreductase MnmC n=1 Tax=Gayadomonas joobiniege TaxID=1234606 RepID=UPI0003705D76|nr:bifunctional tRNA (5-methylaminomethyl-2-thiouridine)(34)-methyltransferase MnmD/FAD-dependent 5-carboxymethylaminomethyl-2-thiouridine(34) oxidoreductase MnmC [Gayadomonas joobiniege]